MVIYHVPTSISLPRFFHHSFFFLCVSASGTDSNGEDSIHSTGCLPSSPISHQLTIPSHAHSKQLMSVSYWQHILSPVPGAGVPIHLFIGIDMCAAGKTCITRLVAQRHWCNPNTIKTHSADHDQGRKGEGSRCHAWDGPKGATKVNTDFIEFYVIKIKTQFLGGR